MRMSFRALAPLLAALVLAAVAVPARAGEGERPARPCASCAGKREVPCAQCGSGGTVQGVCPRCEGKTAYKCSPCHEQGHPGKVTCTVCSGKREIDVPCRLCDGKGSGICRGCNGMGSTNCTSCNGTGIMRGARYKKCRSCNGAGAFDCQICQRRGRLVNCPLVERKKCERCSGSGLNQCPDCVGNGRRKCKECRDGKATLPCSACQGRKVAPCPACSPAPAPALSTPAAARPLEEVLREVRAEGMTQLQRELRQKGLVGASVTATIVVRDVLLGASEIVLAGTLARGDGDAVTCKLPLAAKKDLLSVNRGAVVDLVAGRIAAFAPLALAADGVRPASAPDPKPR